MSTLKKLALFFGDLVILYASLAITLIIRYQGFEPVTIKNHLGPFSIIFMIWLLVFYLAELYRHSSFRSRGSLFRKLIAAIFISGVISVIVFYLLSGIFELTPKTNLFIFAVVYLALDYFFRSTLFGVFRSGGTNILVLGDSPLIKETVGYLKENPQTGYRVSKWLESFDETGLRDVAALIKNGKIELVVVQPKLVSDERAINALYSLLPLGANLMNFSDFYELINEKVPLEEVDEEWFVGHIAPRRLAYDRIKRIVDIAFSFIFGLVLLPFAAVIAVLIKLTSPGPVIYAQERTGRNRKEFTLYKFRSMSNGHQGPLWTEANDARVTKLGRLIRFTHLDELPQLWNILKGDISLVGPRPEAVGLFEKYSHFPYYEIRQVVTPGLTGWAQTHFKPSASLEEAYEKLKYDIYYIENRSVFLDLLIILKTIKYFFVNHN